MSCNPCCCSLKDSAVTIGIWSVVYSVASLVLFSWQTYVLNHCRTVVMAQANLQCEWDCPCVGASNARTTAIIEVQVAKGNPCARFQRSRRHLPAEELPFFSVFAIAQLGIMGWQMAAIKYEKDRAANTLLPNYNTYGKYDIPSYYESYWQSPEERYYIGLFIIQVLCLISVFFLLFAAVAMIWGVHTWSKYLVWPWFPCMVCSILSSLAYCIMWWAGDVRDYWLALTIIEIIGVFVNIYCIVVVLMYYRRITAATTVYEGKGPGGMRRVNRRGRPYNSSRRDLLELSDNFPPPDPRSRSPYPQKQQPAFATPYNQGYVHPLTQPYPSPYSPAGVPQAPLPLPPSYTPYPMDPLDAQIQAYNAEVKKRVALDAAAVEEDPVKRWVKEQQMLDRGEHANSEPISPTREAVQSFPIQHSRSVPSMFDGSLVSHKDCDHHGRHRHHRSSSKRKRSKSRHRDRSPQYSSESETRTDFDRHRRSGSKHRHRSKSRYSESEFTATTDHRDRRDRDRDRKHREDDRRDRRDDEGRKSKRGHKSRDRDRRRDDRDDDDREGRRRHRHRDEKKREEEKPIAQVQTEPDNPFPGFVVPQHIVIPPSSGERGPDGQPLPQKFQINSEITINYDQNGTQQSSEPQQQEAYRRRYAPMQITSNV